MTSFPHSDRWFFSICPRAIPYTPAMPGRCNPLMRRSFDPGSEAARLPLPLFTLREYKAGRIVQRCEYVGEIPLIGSYLL